MSHSTHDGHSVRMPNLNPVSLLAPSTAINFDLSSHEFQILGTNLCWSSAEVLRRIVWYRGNTFWWRCSSSSLSGLVNSRLRPTIDSTPYCSLVLFRFGHGSNLRSVVPGSEIGCQFDRPRRYGPRYRSRARAPGSAVVLRERSELPPRTNRAVAP